VSLKRLAGAAGNRTSDFGKDEHRSRESIPLPGES
jgi:hypothetical protein